MNKASWARHHDDKFVDEIHFVGGEGLPQTYSEVTARAFLRLSLVERYKTSGLSGDEWRFSTAMHIREHTDDEWALSSSGYRDLAVHAQAIYPELFGDFTNDEGVPRWLFKRRVASIAFSWKGLPVYSASYEGASTDLLVACGHLPWALVLAGDWGFPHYEARTSLCGQPGCREAHAGVYRLRDDFCRYCGRKPEHMSGGNLIGFCAKHLRRGDCGREDADANYELVHGVGPNGNEPDPGVVKPSIFGGVIGGPEGEP